MRPKSPTKYKMILKRKGMFIIGKQLLVDPFKNRGTGVFLNILILGPFTPQMTGHVPGRDSLLPGHLLTRLQLPGKKKQDQQLHKLASRVTLALD